MKDVQIGLNFMFRGTAIDEARGQYGTEAEAAMYKMALEQIFVEVLAKFKECGAHPEVLESAAKHCRPSITDVRKALYATARPPA